MLDIVLDIMSDMMCSRLRCLALRARSRAGGEACEMPSDARAAGERPRRRVGRRARHLGGLKGYEPRGHDESRLGVEAFEAIFFRLLFLSSVLLGLLKAFKGLLKAL